MRGVLLLLAVAALGVGATACGAGQGAEEPLATPDAAGVTPAASPTGAGSALPQGGEAVTLDPVDFSTTIDNPYWPMRPGTTWRYRETDGRGGVQGVRVTVTQQTKIVMGIEAVVVHDVVMEEAQLVEDTYDWYAQDKAGNIWYLGEDTKEYENGKVVSTEGSWEAGVDGAQPGIAMPAKPEAGLTYRQEYYAGWAEDAAAILSTEEWVQVPFGSFRDVVLTKDFTPLHPEILEYKLYARNVGPVLVLGVSGGSAREELMTFRER